MTIMHALEFAVVAFVAGAGAGFYFKSYLLKKAEAALVRIKG